MLQDGQISKEDKDISVIHLQPLGCGCGCHDCGRKVCTLAGANIG